MADSCSLSWLTLSSTSVVVSGVRLGNRKVSHTAFAMRNTGRSTPSFAFLATRDGKNPPELDMRFPRDYSELLEQAKVATEFALKDNKQLLEIEFPTAGLGSVPGDGEGGIEMTESMQLIREFVDRFVAPEKSTRTRIFFPEANEVDFARRTFFEATSFKLDYLTKPSLFQDFGFVSRVKMSDRVKPDDEMFLVAYPYFNVNEMLVVEELYEAAVMNTTRKLIIFNGELDRIRSGCILSHSVHFPYFSIDALTLAFSLHSRLFLDVLRLSIILLSQTGFTHKDLSPQARDSLLHSQFQRAEWRNSVQVLSWCMEGTEKTR